MQVLGTSLLVRMSYKVQVLNWVKYSSEYK